jgi:hypothetical protein
MKNRIEDFVRSNREAFDHKEPSGKVWKNIENAVAFTRTNSIWNSVGLWRAAAVLFMAVSLYLGIQRSGFPKQQDLALKEFADVEQFYVQQISEKTDLIQEFQRNEGLNGFTHDFQQLESMYMVLKEEMKNRPSQKVKDALVLNLLVRIDLLNQHLHKLEEQVQPEESGSGEKEKSSKNV